MLHANFSQIFREPKAGIFTGLLLSTLILQAACPGFAAAESDSIKLAAAGNSSASGRIVSDPAQVPGSIEELTRQILLKEVALEKFNLNYKMNAAKQGRWKGWRYAAANQSSAALGIAGGIIGVQQRGIHLHRSSQVKTYVMEEAQFIPMIGTIIAGSAAVIELGINEFHEYEAFTKGFSTGKARQHVNSLKSDINRLMAEREALLRLEESAPLLSGRVEIDSLEGKVLNDLLDQSLLEYQRFHLASRRLLAFQQCQYMFDFAKNTTNSLGSEFGFLSLHRHRRPWNFKAGIMYDTAGALTMTGPIISRIYAKGVSEYHRHYIHDTIKDAEAKEIAQLEADQKALEAACKRGNFSSDLAAKQTDRAALYGDHSKLFQDEVLSAAKELNKAKLVATQNIGAGFYVGGSKLASGILFTIPGYFQLYNKGKSSQTAGRVTNHLLFSSGVIGLQANAFSFLDTLRIQVTGELNRHKLAAGGNLPAQLVQKRLAQLDSMEAKLNAAGN